MTVSHRQTRLWMLLGGLLVCGLLWCGPLRAAVIELRERATVGDSLITLGAVAEIHENDAELKARLERLELGPAPLPGRSQTWTLRMIQDRLRAVGLASSETLYRGSNRVVVGKPIRDPEVRRPETTPRGPIQQVSARMAEDLATPALAAPVAVPKGLRELWESRLEKEILRAVSARHPEMTESAFEVHLDLADLPLLARLASPDVEIVGGQPPFEHPQAFGVRVLDNTGTVQVIEVMGHSIDRPLVWALSQDIPAGMILQPAHLVRQFAETTRHPVNAISDPADVIGWRIRRTTKAGTVITASDVERVVLVKSGDLVTLTVRRGGISVQMAVKAQNSGGLGDLVTLKSLDRRDTFVGQVTGGQAATLSIAGTQISAPAVPANPVRTE